MENNLLYLSKVLELQSEIVDFLNVLPSECMGDKLIRELWLVFDSLDERKYNLMANV